MSVLLNEDFTLHHIRPWKGWAAEGGGIIMRPFLVKGKVDRVSG